LGYVKSGDTQAPVIRRGVDGTQHFVRFQSAYPVHHHGKNRTWLIGEAEIDSPVSFISDYYLEAEAIL